MIKEYYLGPNYKLMINNEDVSIYSEQECMQIIIDEFAQQNIIRLAFEIIDDAMIANFDTKEFPV